MKTSGTWRRLLGWLCCCFWVHAVQGEIMPIDFMPAIGGTSPAIYKSSYLPGKSYLDFKDLTITLTAWNTQLRQDVHVPVEKEPLVVEAFIFPARYNDTCHSPELPIDSTLPQCLNVDILPNHGIGLRKEDFVDEDDYYRHHQDDFLSHTLLCCTDDLVALGKCTQSNTVILNKTIFAGNHLQWYIPVGESHVPEEQFINSSLTLSNGHRYMVVMASCSVDSVPHRNATLRDFDLYLYGLLHFQSFWGYLPLSLVGIWVLFATLSLAYAAILLGYGLQLHNVAQHETHGGSGSGHILRKSEKWICFALFLGLAESVTHAIMWSVLNQAGHFSMTILWIQHALNGIKMCVSFCLGIYLAQAAGYTWQNADEIDSVQHTRHRNSRIPLVLGIAMYAVLRTVQGVAAFCLFRRDFMRSLKYRTAMSIAYTRIYSQQLAALVSICMVIWMLVAVSRTIRYFASLQTDRANRRRYVQLRIIFVIATVASLTTFTCTSFSLPFLTAYSYGSSSLGGPWMFYVSALNDVVYFVTLAGVTYLWRPHANHVEETYLTASLLNSVMEDVQEVSAMEFSASVLQLPGSSSPVVDPSLLAPANTEDTFSDENP